MWTMSGRIRARALVYVSGLNRKSLSRLNFPNLPFWQCPNRGCNAGCSPTPFRILARRLEQRAMNP